LRILIKLAQLLIYGYFVFAVSGLVALNRAALCSYLTFPMIRASFAALVATSSMVFYLNLRSYADPASEVQSSKNISDAVVAGERSASTKLAIDGGFGPQSPRDISNYVGTNKIVFGAAPRRSEMNLCNIHMHEAAEHRGGDFTSYVGNGDGNGRGTGYKYTGYLRPSELRPLTEKVGLTDSVELLPGRTIEIHFVYSTANVKPGPTLAACLSKNTMNPQLRVEAVVAVLVNDRSAVDFAEMAKVSTLNGFSSAPNLPDNLGEPVTYAGSTTGPKYNLNPSPLQVTWKVRPKVVKVDILSVGQWFKSNPFNEVQAQGVRNLILDQALLSPIHASK